MNYFKKLTLLTLSVGAVSIGCSETEDPWIPAPPTAPYAVNDPVPITNPGFENDWSGWSDTDPSAISGDSHSGSKSAKITGSGGKFEQMVSVSPNTSYQLTGYILGKGTIGANTTSSSYNNGGTFGSWTEVSVDFNSGSSTSITIYGTYSGGEGRFDDFAMIETGGSGSEQLTVASVSASADDGNVPANTLDGDLGTRWSADGTGQYITYDLGSSQTVSSMKVAWYKGDERTAYFKIRTGTTTSDMSTIYDASTSGSSGTTLNLETYDFDEVTARYVRITGLGNSSNTWNSITEAEIYGPGSSGGTDSTPPGEVTNLSATPGNNQVTLNWSNPSDSDFNHVEISYNSQTTSTSSESKIITGLTNGTSYTFTVVTYDHTGNASSGESVSATPQSSGSTPFYVINLQDAWKITLPRDDNNDNDADEIFISSSQNDIPADGSLKDYSDNNYFYTDGTWTYFKCQGTGETTGNSSNPRSELREMTEASGGSSQANWDMTNNTDHTLEFTVKVMQTSQSRKLAFAQIHAESGSSWDDILRIQVQSDVAYAGVGDTGHIYIMGSGNGDGHDTILSNYTLGDELNMKIIAKNNQYKVYIDNTEVYASGTNINSDGNYFKAGCYLQSVTSAGTGGEGIVAFKSIVVNH